jgi:glyoxylase-like metal-dependent hydrolase (beta-lactamase superfamily II)/rhodanese-related sulfurtransferase
MTLEQIYTGCLAEAAYYIESNGEAAIIDPLREVQPYIDRAAKDNAKIKYVFETHFHADFVSGHVDLAEKTGATIVYGPTSMETGFEALIAKDGQEFKVGDVTIKLLHTPGHTLESSCYLLTDESGKEVGLFTGDTLFIGDVGRPDLAQKVIAELTQDKLASMMFDSLRNKIMPLNDDIIVYPGHGAGSACGKNMSSETTDTLGNQKKTNYALNPELSREEFIKQLLDGLTPPPGYFPQNVLMNIQGYEKFDNVMAKGKSPLSPRAFETAANETGAVVLDTRDAKDFAKGFIPNSINIGVDGSFASWVGTLVKDVKQEILLVTDPGREEEVITRLARVGFDNVLGYLEGGFNAWKNDGQEVDTIDTVTVSELAKKMESGDINILDVRRASEYNSEHLVGAKNVPLDYINQNMSEVDKDKTWYVHCRSGYRAMVFCSIMRARGYNNLIDVAGAFSEMKENGAFELTDYVCPTTML